MSIRQGKLTGNQSQTAMALEYGVQLQRMAGAFTALGSEASNYATLLTVYPCDIAPIKDDVVMLQSGQQDMRTHIIHFQPGTDVRVRDQAIIVYAPRPGNFGNIGETYLILDVLEPSEDLAYIRCRALKGKVVVG